MYGEIDVESGESLSLCPMIHENLQLKWSFIRRVYSIITFQLLLTIAVVSIVVFVRPVANFFNNSTQGSVLYIVLVSVPLLILCPLYYYQEKHPLNYFLLLIFNVSSALPVGLTCAFPSGKIILAIVILTIAGMLIFTLYTFWAAKKGRDFSILDSLLFGSLFVLILFIFIQIMFPLRKLSHMDMIYGCLACIAFCGYIGCHTDYIIKTYTYDQHIWAFVTFYLDLIDLFLLAYFF